MNVSCRNLFRRGLCVLMILCLGCPAVLAEAGQVRYSSEALALSFDVDANSRVVEQYDYVWVYPGADNSNFRLQWVEDGSADEAAYFESIGNSLREAMGDSMLYDPGTAAGAIDLRGIAMDAMVYAYADADSGQTIEGAYLWEQREGYAILYCAAYTAEYADAVLSGLLLASQTFSPYAQAEAAATASLDEQLSALHGICAGMATATAEFSAAYRESMEQADTSYTSAMLDYVALCEQRLGDVQTIQAAAQTENDGRREILLQVCDVVESMLQFYTGYYHSSDPLMEYQQQAAQGAFSDGASALDGMYVAMGKVKENYQAVACPRGMEQFWPLYISQIDAFREKLYADYVALTRDDALMQFSSEMLIQRQPYLLWHYEEVMYAIMQQQFQNAAAMLEGNVPSGVQLEYAMATEAFPNLYPSMDSVVNLAAYTFGGTKDILVEVQIDGFSQTYRQKLSITPEISYLMIKPPVASAVGSLSSERETQLNLQVTDLESGALLVAESRTITLHSIYDFTLWSDEFGIIEPYNILAWMRPDAEQILNLRRNAIDWLSEAAGEGYNTLPGYQLVFPGETGPEETTYLQAVAIQGALSDLGVRYNMGPYSFGAFQRVLTPDKVIESRSGICIETAILTASALQSANMHAMVLILPGHAQVALETWRDSGQYFLLETTTLPLSTSEEDLNAFCTLLTSDEWREYLQNKVTYVIDCDLAKVLNIKGLALN